MKKITIAITFSLFLFFSLSAQTIAEKKASIICTSSDLSEEMQQLLKKVNDETYRIDCELLNLFHRAIEMHEQSAPPEAFQDLLTTINQLKCEREGLQEQWRRAAAQNNIEDYALWHQPGTTLEQLIIDYGAQDFVYLIPPQVASIPINISSNLPIPRSSWNEMLDAILTQNGVGIKQLNPFLRELYLLKDDHSGVKLITNNRCDLLGLQGSESVAFILSPEPSDVRRTWFFLEKFINPMSTTLQMIGRDILIIAQASEVQDLLKLYDFISANKGNKEYKVVTLSRVNAEEMARILSAIFGGLAPQMPMPPPMDLQRPKLAIAPKPGMMPPPPMAPRPPEVDDNGLQIIPLVKVAQAIFLIGTREEIIRAENIIREVEDQLGETKGKVIFWYTAKHSDAEELAAVLSKVYLLLIQAESEGDQEIPPGGPIPLGPTPEGVVKVDRPIVRRPYDEGYFLDDRFVINKTPPIENASFNSNRDNFIVDPKSGSIAMVVEADLLPKLKELIKKLDVPKKMVQIEVLLFEKRLRNENDFGLNLFRIGSAALNKNLASATFNNIFPVEGGRVLKDAQPGNAGVFDFIFSRKGSCNSPAYDLAYRFLLTQDDIRINASPSVIAINQTQATIEITDEISVSTGIFEVETISGVTLKDSFARAQYGIKIDVIPTIHAQEEGDETDYVTLATDITFQTFVPALDSRPDVTTRHITNEVRVPDGQTIILGGLRQKSSNDFTEAVPFLGELPGIGKFFSITEMADNSTEMFIFLTPRIIYNPVDDLEKLKCLEMARRPGDLPEFLAAIVEAQEWEREHLVHGSMLILLGRPRERLIMLPGEYDGR